jgi:hypothetical protein
MLTTKTREYVPLITVNPNIAPLLLSAHESQRTKIPLYTVFRFIFALDITPQTVVLHQRLIAYFLRVV